MSGGGGRFRVAFAATLRPWAISMFGKIRFSRWLIAAAVLAVAECAGVAAVEFAFTAPAQAQFFGDQQYRRAPPRSGGFLQNFFGPFNSRPYEGEYGPPQQKQKQPRQHTQQPSESSHAPAPRKTESKGEQVAPTTSIVVMGDGMADCSPVPTSPTATSSTWASRATATRPPSASASSRTSCAAA